MCGPSDDHIVSRNVRFDTTTGSSFKVEVPQSYLQRRVTHWRIAEFATSTNTQFNALVFIPQFSVNAYSSDAVPSTGILPQLSASVALVIPTTTDGRGPSSPRPWIKFEATNKQTLPNFFDVQMQWNGDPIGSGPGIDASAQGIVDITFQFIMDDGHKSSSGCQ